MNLTPQEIDEQAAFFDGVAWSYKTHDGFCSILLFATFNGEIWRSRNKLEHAGLVKGVPDILYLQPRGGYAYFACELKRKDRKGKRNGGATPEELAWLSEARKEFAFTCIAHGADEALRYFASYMGFQQTHTLYTQFVSDSHLDTRRTR